MEFFDFFTRHVAKCLQEQYLQTSYAKLCKHSFFHFFFIFFAEMLHGSKISITFAPHFGNREYGITCFSSSVG